MEMEYLESKKRESKRTKRRRSRTTSSKHGGEKRRRVSVTEADGPADEFDEIYYRKKVHHGIAYHPEELHANTRESGVDSKKKEQEDREASDEDIVLPQFEGRQVTPSFRCRPKPVGVQAPIPTFKFFPKKQVTPQKEQRDQAVALKALQQVPPQMQHEDQAAALKALQQVPPQMEQEDQAAVLKALQDNYASDSDSICESL